MIITRLSRYFSKIKKDLLNNPEFDQIHPQFLEHKPPTTLHRQQKEVPYMKSLLKYKSTNKHSFEEALNSNFKTFVEGYISPKGPLKNLSEETMKAIQIQVAQKLQELEDTGLSREEILTNGIEKGIPLSQDAFFQLIKNNENARLVYLKPGEDFTVQKVVDVALRQDLGPDQFNVPINKYDNNMKLANHDKQKDIFINTKEHMEHVNELIIDEVVYHHPPKQAKPVRRVNNYDIHWRNTEFLIQFLNKSSKIRNRHQTNLAEVQQKKVARAIKTAKQMLLLPYNSTIQPYHRKSLTSLEDDVQDYARRKVNIATGQVYAETPLQKRERSVEHLAMIDDYELNVGVARPNDKQVIKAIVYAEKLKKKEVNAKGVTLTLDEEQERTFRFVGNQVKFQSIREEELAKQEIKKEIAQKDGEFVEEFQKLKSQIEKIPTYRVSEAFISEQTLESERIAELMKIPQKKYSLEESVKIIEEVKARLHK